MSPCATLPRMTDALLLIFSVAVLGWVLVQWWRGKSGGRGPLGLPPGSDGGGSDVGGGGS
jgi:hypothetical protein